MSFSGTMSEELFNRGTGQMSEHCEQPALFHPPPLEEEALDLSDSDSLSGALSRVEERLEKRLVRDAQTISALRQDLEAAQANIETLRADNEMLRKKRDEAREGLDQVIGQLSQRLEALNPDPDSTPDSRPEAGD